MRFQSISCEFQPFFKILSSWFGETHQIWLSNPVFDQTYKKFLPVVLWNQKKSLSRTPLAGAGGVLKISFLKKLWIFLYARKNLVSSKHKTCFATSTEAWNPFLVNFGSLVKAYYGLIEFFQSQNFENWLVPITFRHILSMGWVSMTRICDFIDVLRGFMSYICPFMFVWYYHCQRVFSQAMSKSPSPMKEAEHPWRRCG